MKHNLIISLLCILLLAGCKSESQRLKSPTGYEYQVIHTDKSKPTVPLDSYVFFNMKLMQKDSVITSTEMIGEPSILKVMADNASYGKLEGMVDVVSTLHVGDSFHFFMPIDSFETLPENLEGTTDPLVYHIGILKVIDEQGYQMYTDSVQKELEKIRQADRDRLPEVEAFVKSNWDAYKKGELDSQMKTAPSGLRYIIHSEGIGQMPLKGEAVSVHYYGMLDADAKMFDTSFKSGTPYQFPIGEGQVIQGWDQGLTLFKRGTKATLYIPAALGYGAAGSPPVIPENADLIFYVELGPK